MKKHLPAIFGYGTLILLGLVLALVAYWLLYPYNPIDNSEVIMADKTVQQGQLSSYKFDYCKNEEYPAKVRKDFVDGIIFQMESPKSTLPTGCHSIVVPLPIPETLPPGMYKVRITAIYRVNPIRTITNIIETETFSVIKKGI